MAAQEYYGSAGGSTYQVPRSTTPHGRAPPPTTTTSYSGKQFGYPPPPPGPQVYNPDSQTFLSPYAVAGESISRPSSSHSTHRIAGSSAPPYDSQYASDFGHSPSGKYPHPSQNYDLNAHYDPNAHFDPNDPNAPPGERGLVATMVGGAGGAYLTHQAGGGFLATAAGALTGAIAANAVEHKIKKHKKHKKEKKEKKKNKDKEKHKHKHHKEHKSSSSSKKHRHHRSDSSSSRSSGRSKSRDKYLHSREPSPTGGLYSFGYSTGGGHAFGGRREKSRYMTNTSSWGIEGGRSVRVSRRRHHARKGSVSSYSSSSDSSSSLSSDSSSDSDSE